MIRASADDGALTFTLYSVPPDSSATISPGGGTVSLTTTTPGQNMGLSFSGTSGSRVSLYANETSGLGSCADLLTVTAPDGSTSLFSGNPYCNTVFTGVLPTESPITSHVSTLSTTGTYTIALSPQDGTVGTAAFTLYSVPADISGALTIGAAATSFSTTAPGQSIRATFPGTKSQKTTVAASAKSVTPSGGCYNVTILEPNGTTIFRAAQSCSANYSSGSVSLPSSGTYTVVLSAADLATGTYTLRVTTP